MSEMVLQVVAIIALCKARFPRGEFVRAKRKRNFDNVTGEKRTAQQ